MPRITFVNPCALWGFAPLLICQPETFHDDDRFLPRWSTPLMMPMPVAGGEAELMANVRPRGQSSWVAGMGAHQATGERSKLHHRRPGKGPQANLAPSPVAAQRLRIPCRFHAATAPGSAGVAGIRCGDAAELIRTGRIRRQSPPRLKSI